MSDACRRLTLETRTGAEVNFGPDFEIASDSVVLLYDGAVLLGWADDYGTVTHPDHELDPAVRDAAERLVEATANVWALLVSDTPSRGQQ